MISGIGSWCCSGIKLEKVFIVGNPLPLVCCAGRLDCTFKSEARAIFLLDMLFISRVWVLKIDR